MSRAILQDFAFRFLHKTVKRYGVTQWVNYHWTKNIIFSKSDLKFQRSTDVFRFIHKHEVPMTNNDILRRIRYTFDFNDTRMVALFALADHKVSREQISAWLKKDDAPGYQQCSDTELAIFLNGLINDKRGKKPGPQVKPEQSLTNNIIFRKLKIAFNLKDEDILAIMELADFRMSKHELSAFFRKPEHKNYRECKNQILRNFLTGMQLKYKAI